jgi:asparagine synthase (glutamine-hydrolysing)
MVSTISPIEPVGRISPELIELAAGGSMRRSISHTRSDTLGDCDGLLAVTFNGCIYNHRELRSELIALGHRFNSDHSDTEVILHGFRQWGTGLIHRLDGMFAIAVYDRTRGQVTLMRDAAGQKPLWYCETGVASMPAGTQRVQATGERVLMFASLPAPLLATVFAASPAGVDLQSLTRWLHQGYDTQSLYGPIRQVFPGEVVVWPPVSSRQGIKADKWSEQRSVELPARSRVAGGGLNADALDARLQQIMPMHLDADVPLGCFLSGGIDSSLIAAYASKHRADLRAFTVAMPAGSYDESPLARQIAHHLKIDHQVLACDAGSAASDLVQLISLLGLPLGDSSLLPTYWVSRAARQHVRVALSGDGGDELFGGYDRYRAARLLARWKSWLSRVPVAPGLGLDPKSRRTRAARLLTAARNLGYVDLTAIFPSPMLRALMPQHAGASGLPCEVLVSPEGLAPKDPLRLDFDTYLPGDLMMKVDTASMAVALEVRAPLLSQPIRDAALATPLETLMPGGRLKGLLRELAGRHLPADITRAPKRGFSIPLGDWFRSDFGKLRQLLLDHLTSSEPFGKSSLGIDLHRPTIQRLLDEHLGMGSCSRPMVDHSQRLYMLLTLSIWAKGLSSHAQIGRPG